MVPFLTYDYMPHCEVLSSDNLEFCSCKGFFFHEEPICKLLEGVFFGVCSFATQPNKQFPLFYGYGLITDYSLGSIIIQIFL